jgi:hypothetical protein
MHTKFWSENVQGTENSEDLGVDEKIKLVDLREIVWGVVDWMHLAEDRVVCVLFSKHGIEPSDSTEVGEFLNI